MWNHLTFSVLIIILQFFSNGATSLSDFWTPTLAYYAMYEWKDIAEISKELLALDVRKMMRVLDDEHIIAVISARTI